MLYYKLPLRTHACLESANTSDCCDDQALSTAVAGAAGWRSLAEQADRHGGMVPIAGGGNEMAAEL